MTACNCIGPQNGEPLCPCQMRSVFIEDGRWVRRIDLGPAPKQRIKGGHGEYESLDEVRDALEKMGWLIKEKDCGFSLERKDGWGCSVSENSRSIEAWTLLLLAKDLINANRK